MYLYSKKKKKKERKEKKKKKKRKEKNITFFSLFHVVYTTRGDGKKINKPSSSEEYQELSDRSQQESYQTTKADSEYSELENQSKGSDAVYFQLEKDDTKVNAQVESESLQDYDQLRTAATLHIRGGQKNAATAGDTYQHLKSHVATDSGGDDDYQHLKRDGF